MKRTNEVSTLLDMAGFFAVFATLYGAVCVVVPTLALFSGATDMNSLRSALLGAALLAVSFWVFRAHDRARSRAQS